MVIGIRPTNDFAFKKTFGSPKNKLALISLLNAILQRAVPIRDVVIENPYNSQDFQYDKLSVLDVKATDDSGTIYDIEIQLATPPGLVQRLVFYGCDLYADQLRSGDEYTQLKPVVIIALLEESLWSQTPQLHHQFMLTDRQSGRQLDETLSIHTLELAKYNRTEADLDQANPLEQWLFWLLHADDYEADRLLELFPQPDFQLASETLINISEMTEDKTMYDAREKAIRDQIWINNAIVNARKEAMIEGLNQGKIEGKIEGEIKGKIEGEIKMIRIFQEILNVPVNSEEELGKQTLEQLQAQAAELRNQFHHRPQN